MKESKRERERGVKESKRERERSERMREREGERKRERRALAKVTSCLMLHQNLFF